MLNAVVDVASLHAVGSPKTLSFGTVGHREEAVHEAGTVNEVIPLGRAFTISDLSKQNATKER